MAGRPAAIPHPTRSKTHASRGVVPRVPAWSRTASLVQDYLAKHSTLPARETALTFIELLLIHHPQWKSNPPEDYELARLLKTSPRKIRNIRDDLSYRDIKKTDVWCKKQLADALSNAERIQDGNYVVFQIDDGLIRDYAKKIVRHSDSVFESGFSSSTIKISGKTFISLVLLLLDEPSREKIIDSIPAEKKEDAPQNKSPIKIFVDSFAKAAGEQAGKKTVDLAFTILSGGLSDISSAIATVTSYFE